MKWKKFKIKTRTEAEDIIISTLYDIGLEGAQIEDNVTRKTGVAAENIVINPVAATEN